MRSSRLVLLGAATLLAGSAVAACTSDGDDKAEEPAESTSTQPTTDASLTPAEFTVKAVSIDSVKPKDRAQLIDALAAPIQTWFNGAFVEGDYPRDSYGAGMASWTRDAARLATRDRNTTTNGALGNDVVRVVPTAQGVQLYVFANKGVPGGATARVRLGLIEEKSSGDLVRVSVTGTVYLTKDKAAWKIFGYDLHRTEAPG